MTLSGEPRKFRDAISLDGDSEVILHSDRGGQFISGTYQKFLGGNALVCSMSAVGHCGDNAACEGFFAVLKRERVYRQESNTVRPPGFGPAA